MVCPRPGYRRRVTVPPSSDRSTPTLRLWRMGRRLSSIEANAVADVLAHRRAARAAPGRITADRRVTLTYPACGHATSETMPLEWVDWVQNTRRFLELIGYAPPACIKNSPAKPGVRRARCSQQAPRNLMSTFGHCANSTQTSTLRNTFRYRLPNLSFTVLSASFDII
jgi:hypothetical protein